MSLTQKHNFRLILNVLRQLRAFGLNPHDWRVERAGSINDIRMYHREDMEFRLRGHVSRTTRGLYRLEALKIASL